ncbi:extracellular solute-binding protein [Halorientalis pallida]|uniref:extracellular solute-binding protein n=1 Tax=Halorientalis pallida TaxID=2479928 RepID=UPI00187D2BFA|nr:extracellular solute-binding protein [Halorientalis pallida]
MTRRNLLVGLGGTAVAGGIGVAVYGTVAEDGDRTPSVLVAGSLLSVASQVSGATVEAHGSVAVRRLIRDGLRDPDGVALADPRLFDGIADRVTAFATNALVIAYNPDSAHADRIRDDWTSAVQRSVVDVGRTDPAVDPLGYRTVMALDLAAEAGLLDADQTLDNARILPETDLSNVLERGDLDAAFVYRNMAIERDLPYVSLPDRIDFSSPDAADSYARASYDLDDRTVRGRPIRYAATALTDAGQPWIDRLTGGRERLRTAGFGVPESYPERHGIE